MFKCSECNKCFKHRTNVYRHKKESCIFRSSCSGSELKITKKRKAADDITDIPEKCKVDKKVPKIT